MIFFFCHALFALVVYVHILTRRLFFPNNFLWLIWVTFFPWGGFLYFFVGYSNWRKVIKTDIDGCHVLKSNLLSGVPKDWKALSSASAGNFALTTGSFEFSKDYDTYRAIFGAIDNAEHYVIVSTYIFKLDKIGNELLNRLQEAHDSGVKVFVLFNSIKDIGERTLPYYVADFGQKGKLQFFNIIQHSKFVLVDGEGFIFSGNFWKRVNPDDPTLPPVGQERATRNIGVKIKGNHVLDVFYLFRALWKNSQVVSGGQEASHVALDDVEKRISALVETKSETDTALGKIVFRGEGNTFFAIEEQLINACALAQKEICIVTPYPVFAYVFVRSMVACLRRGVSVKLITPQHIDQGFLSRAVLKSSLEWLSYLGISIYYDTGKFDHSKIITVDDFWMTVGSSNFDKRSTYISYETNLEIWDQSLVKKVKETIIQPKQSVALCDLNFQDWLLKKLWRRLLFTLFKDLY